MPLSPMTQAFLADYAERHSHPVNAALHYVGVPMAVTGLGALLLGKGRLGLTLLAGGYLLQWAGHEAQGNEVGEVTLIRHLLLRALCPQARAAMAAPAGAAPAVETVTPPVGEE